MASAFSSKRWIEARGDIGVTPRLAVRGGRRDQVVVEREDQVFAILQHRRLELTFALARPTQALLYASAAPRFSQAIVSGPSRPLTRLPWYSMFSSPSRRSTAATNSCVSGRPPSSDSTKSRYADVSSSATSRKKLEAMPYLAVVSQHGVDGLALVQLFAGQAGDALALLDEAQERRAMEEPRDLDQVVHEIAVQARRGRDQDVVAPAGLELIERAERGRCRCPTSPARRTRRNGGAAAAARRRFRFERDGAAEFARLIAELHDRGRGGSFRRSASSAIPQLPPVHVVTSRMSGQTFANVRDAAPRSAAARAGSAFSLAVTTSRTGPSSPSNPSSVPVSSDCSSRSRRAFRMSSSRRNVDGFGEPM